MTALRSNFAIDALVATAPAGDDGPQTGETASPTREVEDLRLYRRHTEGGESIRSLAREAGCHASTILRRIRRIEARRDDPLVDGGIGRQDEDNPQGFSRSDAEQARRVLRRLAESRAVMVLAEGMEKAIVVRGEIRTAILDRRIAEKLALMGWVAQQSGGRLARYAITTAGRDALRAMVAARRGGVPPQADFAQAQKIGPAGMAEGAAGFDHADGHRLWHEREITDPEDGTRRRARFNLAESPLQVLARRRDVDGQPFLAPSLVEAGERLREDFELSQIGPRVAQNWDRFLTSGVDAGRRADGFSGGSDGARNRVALALRELGPGMGDLCLRVCCFLEGVEMTERRLGWSARSGKIVLRLALMRLERHYRETYGSGAPMIG